MQKLTITGSQPGCRPEALVLLLCQYTLLGAKRARKLVADLPAQPIHLLLTAHEATQLAAQTEAFGFLCCYL